MSKSGSKKKVVVTTPKKKTKPSVARRRTSGGASQSSTGHELIFGKTNYLLMVAGIGVIALGLFLMSGGAMPSPDVWDDDLIYSTRRTVIAPLVIIVGLVLEIVAIFKKDKSETPVELPG